MRPIQESLMTRHDTLRRTLLAGAALALTGPALAHPGHDTTGPLEVLQHALAFVAQVDPSTAAVVLPMLAAGVALLLRRQFRRARA
jgi:hypothetical protein